MSILEKLKNGEIYIQDLDKNQLSELYKYMD